MVYIKIFQCQAQKHTKLEDANDDAKFDKEFLDFTCKTACKTVFDHFRIRAHVPVDVFFALCLKRDLQYVAQCVCYV